MAGFGENRFIKDGGIKDVFGSSPNLKLQFNRILAILGIFDNTFDNTFT